MSEQSPPSSPGTGRRRSSFTDLFLPRPTVQPHSASCSPPTANPPTSGGNTQGSSRRGISISTLGLNGGSASQSSPLNAFAKQRRASIASSSASGSPEFRNSFEDNAVIEEDMSTGVPANTPATPSFARRVSFGAQALRDVRSTGVSSGGRRPFLSATLPEQPENQTPRNDTSLSSSGAATRGGSRGEGFNWSEALRDRTKRQPSISAGSNPFQARARAASVTTTTTTTTPMEPPKEMPKPQSPPTPAKLRKPDQLGERMLRGDFMMD